MSEQNPAIFIQSESHPAEDVRRAFTAITGWSGDGGTVDAGSLAVSEKSGTPDMSVDVASGAIWVPGDEATYQGMYFCESRGTVNKAISAADPTNARKDLVVAQVEDSAYSGATDAWSIAVVTGTPAASPAEPTVPDNAIVLALVDVAALATSIVDANITDRRIVSTGGQAPRGIRKTDSSNHPSTAPEAGDLIFETDTERFLFYDGGVSDFVEIGSVRSATGSASFGGSTNWTQAATVTLPRGTWAITATGYFEWSTAAAYVNDARIEQDNTTTLDTAKLTQPGTGGHVPWTLTDVLTVTGASSTIDVDVKTDTAAGSQLASSVHIMAIAVSP